MRCLVMLMSLALVHITIANAALAEESKAQIVTVVVNGTGIDEDGALKQAFTNAVQQVVGTVIDAETMVKNDEILRDQVLTASNAIIEGYDIVGSPRHEHSLVTVTIRARVQKGALLERLQKAKVTQVEVRGGDLWAKAITEAQKEQDATKVVGKLLSYLTQRFLIATAGQPTYDRKSGELVVPIQLSVDQKAYDAWYAAATPLLAKAASRSKTVRPDLIRDLGMSKSMSIKSEPTSDKTQWNAYWHIPEQALKNGWSFPRNGLLKKLLGSDFDSEMNVRHLLVWRRTPGSAVSLRFDAEDAFSNIRTQPLEIEVVVVGVGDAEIEGTILKLWGYTGRIAFPFGGIQAGYDSFTQRNLNNSNRQIITIQPFVTFTRINTDAFWDLGAWLSSISIEARLALTPEQVKEMKRVQVKVVMPKDESAPPESN